MNEFLKVAEIKSKYDSEWVLIEDPQTNEPLEVQIGRGLYQSKERDEFDRKALGFHPKRFAVLYTGIHLREWSSRCESVSAKSSTF